MVLTADEKPLTLYSEYLPNNPHKERLNDKVEDIYGKLVEGELPAGRYYLVLTIDGTIKETDEEFTMPPIKYCFKPKD